MKYLIYDSALESAYTLMVLKKCYNAHCSLLKGTKDEKLEDVGPWLFQIDDNLHANLAKDIGASILAPLFLTSDENLDGLRIHLTGNLYQTIEGREYFFRFWDGRVLAKYLPTCTKQQLSEFFGRIDCFLTSADTQNGAIRYHLEKGLLKKENIETLGERSPVV